MKSFFFIIIQMVSFVGIALGQYSEVDKYRYERDLNDAIQFNDSYRSFLFAFTDATTKKRLPKGTVVNINATVTNVVIWYKDFRTSRMFGEVSYYISPFKSLNGIGHPSYLTYISDESDNFIDLPAQAEVPQQINTQNGECRIFWPERIDGVLDISAYGYEPKKISISSNNFIEIALIPQLTNVKLSGSVDVNNTNQNNKNNSLDIYSTKQIAEILGLQEDDIISLIKSNKLKGKIIGSKYFVRKEDLNIYMQK